MDFEQELKQVAKRYEEEGYAVVIHPRREQLPSFAKPFVVDILATKGDQSVLAVVRRKRRDLADEALLSQLAEITNAKPAWRFDLVITEPESPIEKVADKAREPTREELSRMLERARVVGTKGFPEMALVSAWAVLEAAMRRLRDDGELYGQTTPTELLVTLYSNGFMSRREFDRAKAAWRLRTEIVHGFVRPKVAAALVDDVMALAKKMIGSDEPAASQAVGG